MKDRRLKRILTSAAAVLLAFCMSAGSFTARVFAEEEEKNVFETQNGSENGKNSGEEILKGQEEPASEEPGEDNPGAEGADNPATEKSGTEEPEDSEKKTETDNIPDNSIGGDENETEEIPVEEPFEETGIFGCYTVNSYGRVINSRYDSSRNAYYLFLTNTGTPEDFSLYCTGVKPAAVSAGELDEATHVITGAFPAVGSEVEVTGSNGQKYTVIAMQSELPSLYISLNGTTLSHINSNGKNEKYNGNSLILTDESGSINLEQDGTVQIKGRGNTSWVYASKKGYQLKFDKKQKVLGMAKAKKWVLLANSFDDSMARNMTAFHAASSLDMEYVTEYRYVDLWVDGDYQGTYILGEKSEINENRLNLTDPSGVLMELDNFFYEEEDYWFTDAYLNYRFTVKECVDEDNPESVLAGMNQFRDRLDSLWSYLSGADVSAVTLEELEKYIDPESFARWYLVNEFACNVEAASTSCFFYMDGADDVIHMGPVWDFDSSMGNKAGYSDITLMYLKTKNKIFSRLLQVPAFAEFTKNILVQYDSAFESLAVYAEDTGTLIKESAAMNYIRWDMLGKPNEKVQMLPYAPTYDTAVQVLSDWLRERYGFFTGKTDVTAALEGKNIVVRINDYHRLNSVNVAAWTKDNGQKDLMWRSSGRSGGVFTVAFPLSRFLSAGKVLIHIYGDGIFQKEAVVTIPVPEVEYRVSEDGKTLVITADTIGIFDSIHTAVWSKTGGQDDIVWYTLAKSADGTYTKTVSLLNHGKSDTYYFHTYGVSSGRNIFVSAKTEEVTMDIPVPEILLDKSEDNGTLTITLKNASDKTGIRFAVWGAADGQNDLKWYNGVKQADGSWKATVNLNSHRENGTLYVDCWTAKDYVTGKTCELEFAPDDPGTDEPEPPVSDKPVLTVTVSEDNKTIVCTLANAPEYTRVRFPSWTTKNGQDDLKWYEASNDGSGNWTYVIQTASHGGAGEYNVHCYGIKNGVTSIIGGMTVTAAAPAVSKPEVKAAKSGSLIKAEALNASSYTNVRFAVWTAEDGQDDIRWYKGTLSGSVWTCSFNLAVHTPGSQLVIHAYGYLNGKDTFIGSVNLMK